MTTTWKLVALALSVAAATPAFADGFFGGFTTQGESMDPYLDETGFSLFHVNVAYAGNTPAAVKQFYAALKPGQKHSIDVGCREVLADHAYGQNLTVTMFCRNLKAS
jgi:hypothetical protein